jgi:hypothetical protein
VTTNSATGSTGNLERRLAAYGSMTLALAAVSMPAAARAASIAYSANITTGNGQAGAVFFDLITGTNGHLADFPGSVVPAGDFELLTDVQGTSNLVFKARMLVSPNNAFSNGNQFAGSASLLFGGGASSIARFSPGASVGPNLRFSSANGTLAEGSIPAFGHWNSTPASGDLGLRTGVGTPQILFGWANITVNPDFTITLHSFGFDNAGNPVIAGDAVVSGAVAPEPASIILLALGAAGIGAWRRKKTIAPASQPVA